MTRKEPFSILSATTRRVAILAACCAGAVAFAADCGWKVLPLAGGGNITGVEIAPSDPSVWYAHADVGGPWRSDDAGLTWRPLHGNMTAGMRLANADHVRNLSVDPGDPNRFVFVSGWLCETTPAGAYVSNDGGRTFRRSLKAKFKGEGSRSKRLGRVLARNPLAPQELLAAAEGDGIFLSTDGGETWTPCGGDGFEFCDVLYDKTVPGRAFASASPSASPKTRADIRHGLLRSDDDGRSWTVLFEGDAPAEMAQIEGRGELLGIFDVNLEGEMKGSSVRISRDGGETWTDWSEGLPRPTAATTNDGNDRPATFQALAAGPDCFLAANWSGRLFRRTPDMAAWVEIPVEGMTLGCPEKQTFLEEDVALKRRRCTCSITVDPRDPEHILTTDWYQIWESFDGGRNWRTATDGISPLVPFTVSLDPHSESNVVYGVADAGLFFSDNGGATFSTVRAISSPSSFAWSSRITGRIWVCGGKSGLEVAVSDDSGRTWRVSRREGLPERTDDPSRKHLAYTVAADPTTDFVYLCVGGEVGPGKGGIYRSPDGDVWEWSGAGLDASQRLYKNHEFSHGGRAGWPPQLVFSPDGSAMTCGPASGETYWLDKSVGEWRKVDGTFKDGQYTIAADPFAPGRFLLCGNGRILEFSEGGRTVRFLPGSEGLGPSLAFDAKTPGLVAAMTADGEDICISWDGGRHWGVLPGGMDVPTGNTCALVLDRKRLFVLTRGSGVWARTIPAGFRGNIDLQPITAGADRLDP